jgi:hypothetical protein
MHHFDRAVFSTEHLISFMSRSLILALCSFATVGFTGCLAEGFIDVSVSEADFDGPEALSWLKDNRNESALASNRFGPTENAVRFVQSLYNAGALRVVVPRANITDDEDTLKWEDGPYADAVVVELPNDADRRDKVWAICAREIRREGFDPADGADDDGKVFLWWD